MATGTLSTFIKAEFAASWTVDSYSAVLLDNTYIYNAAHNALDDISGGSILDTIAVPSRTNVGGICDCGDLVFTFVGTGRAVWIYKDTGTPSTSTLAYFANQFADGSTMSITTSPYTLTISNAGNGVFTI
jgi:hypothetical protein